MVLLLAGCASEKKEKEVLNIGVFKGPTGIGAVELISHEYEDYSIEMYAESNDMVSRVVNGDLDIAALPTNLASNLYNKLNGDLEVIALNCLGVLYILENGESIKSVNDLKGKTILCNGQGANPEFVLRYILEKNDVEANLEFKDASEIVTLMASGQAEICMLPVPACTTVMMKNSDVKAVLDLSKEYEKVTDDGSLLTMGCLVSRKGFIENHKEEIELFLDRYEESVDYVRNNPPEAGEMIFEAGITPNAKIGELCIPYAGLTFIRNKEIKDVLEGYLEVLYTADEKSVGGKMPDDDFYYSYEK